MRGDAGEVAIESQAGDKRPGSLPRPHVTQAGVVPPRHQGTRLGHQLVPIQRRTGIRLVRLDVVVTEHALIFLQHRVIQLGFSLRIFQSVGLLAAVTKFERVLLDRWHRHGFVLAAIEEMGEPLIRRETHVKA